MIRWAVAATTLLLFAPGCSLEELGQQGASGGGDLGEGGDLLELDVPASGRVFVRLATAEVVTPADDGAGSTGWDLAFSGYEVFTNSGESGPGDGGALPIAPEDYTSGKVKEAVFFIEDAAGGAFSRWYHYDGEQHVAYSRFHVHGIEHEGRTWKLQIVSFYGEVDGAPVTGLYHLRYAEVLPDGSGPTIDVEALDATAGGRNAPETAPSACLDLASGEQRMLTPAEARAETAWHVCFRRSLISVNGELGGPGTVRGADLDGDETSGETLDDVKSRTAESELARFDAVDHAVISDPAIPYRGDHIETAFSGRWLDPESDPAAPAKDLAWLVRSADVGSRYVAVIERFDGATESSPGRVVMRVKPVQ
jgi:hypothetical protein